MDSVADKLELSADDREALGQAISIVGDQKGLAQACGRSQSWVSALRNGSNSSVASAILLLAQELCRRLITGGKRSKKARREQTTDTERQLLIESLRAIESRAAKVADTGRPANGRVEYQWPLPGPLIRPDDPFYIERPGLDDALRRRVDDHRQPAIGVDGGLGLGKSSALARVVATLRSKKIPVAWIQCKNTLSFSANTTEAQLLHGVIDTAAQDWGVLPPTETEWAAVTRSKGKAAQWLSTIPGPKTTRWLVFAQLEAFGELDGIDGDKFNGIPVVHGLLRAFVHESTLKHNPPRALIGFSPTSVETAESWEKSTVFFSGRVPTPLFSDPQVAEMLMRFDLDPKPEMIRALLDEFNGHPLLTHAAISDFKETSGDNGATRFEHFLKSFTDTLLDEPRPVSTPAGRIVAYYLDVLDKYFERFGGETSVEHELSRYPAEWLLSTLTTNDKPPLIGRLQRQLCELALKKKRVRDR